MMIAVLRHGIVWVPHKQRSAWEEGWTWYPSKCFQAAMEVYIGEGMARTARAMQTRPKEPGQKNMKAN